MVECVKKNRKSNVTKENNSYFCPQSLNIMCMNKKTLLFLLLLALMTPFVAIAQSITVSGKVVSSDDGYGLPGVTIQVKGASTGTVTDMEGNYSLNADSKDVLVFSFVGYKTKEIAIKGKNKINVTLEVDSQTRRVSPSVVTTASSATTSPLSSSTACRCRTKAVSPTGAVAVTGVPP